jgi:hypothetical protein
VVLQLVARNWNHITRGYTGGTHQWYPSTHGARKKSKKNPKRNPLHQTSRHDIKGKVNVLSSQRHDYTCELFVPKQFFYLFFKSIRVKLMTVCNSDVHQYKEAEIFELKHTLNKKATKIAIILPDLA